MAQDIDIKDLIDFLAMENKCARIQFLLKRLIKDAEKLSQLGVSINLNDAECAANEELCKTLSK